MPDMHDVLDRRARSLQPSTVPAAFDRTLRRARRRHRNRRLGAAVIAFAVFAGAGTGLWLAFQPGRSKPTPSSLPTPVDVTRTALDVPPTDLVLTRDFLWVTQQPDLLGLDPTTGGETGFMRSVGGSPITAVSEDTCGLPVWGTKNDGVDVVCTDPGRIGPIGPRATEVGGTVTDVVGLADGSAWATVKGCGNDQFVRGACAYASLNDRLVEVRKGGNLGRTFRIPAGPTSLAVGTAGGVDGALYVASEDAGGQVEAIDPATGDRLGLWLEGQEPGNLASGAGEVWASGDGFVERIAPTVGKPVSIPGAGALVVQGAVVWVVASHDPQEPGLLYEVDRRTGEIVGEPTKVGSGPVAVVANEDVVWIANHDDSSLTRVRLVCCGEIQPTPSPELSATTQATNTANPTPTVTTPTPTVTGGVADLGAPSVPFVSGNRVERFGEPDLILDHAAEQPLAGWLAPEATFLGNRVILYVAWQETRSGRQRAVIRARQTDTSVDVGQAFGDSFAIRDDGEIAYFEATTPEYVPNQPYVGQIIVGLSKDSIPEQWTVDDARYVVAGWAGQTLLVYRVGDGEVSDVLALDDPGQIRTLAKGAVVVAISPDGSRVMLAGQPDGSNIPDTVEVVDVADGTVAASTRISTLRDPASPSPSPIVAIGASGDWVGDRVVAPASGATVVLRVQGANIELERAVQTGEPGDALNEPQFVNHHTDRIIGWSAVHQPGVADLRYAWTECELSGARPSCVTGPAELEPVRPIRSLSRPVNSPS